MRLQFKKKTLVVVVMSFQLKPHANANVPFLTLQLAYLLVHLDVLKKIHVLCFPQTKSGLRQRKLENGLRTWLPTSLFLGRK
jgi:hypothetical protein